VRYRALAVADAAADASIVRDEGVEGVAGEGHCEGLVVVGHAQLERLEAGRLFREHLPSATVSGSRSGWLRVPG
jgi:hypothetical protein